MSIWWIPESLEELTSEIKNKVTAQRMWGGDGIMQWCKEGLKLDSEEFSKLQRYLASMPLRDEVVDRAQTFISDGFEHVMKVEYAEHLGVSSSHSLLTSKKDRWGLFRKKEGVRQVYVPTMFLDTKVTYHLDGNTIEEEPPIFIEYNHEVDNWNVQWRGIKKIDVLRAKEEREKQMVLVVNIDNFEHARELADELQSRNAVNSVYGYDVGVLDSLNSAAAWAQVHDGYTIESTRTINGMVKSGQEERENLLRGADYESYPL